MVNKKTITYIILSILVLIIIIEGYYLYTYYNSTQILADTLQRVYESDLATQNVPSYSDSQYVRSSVMPIDITGTMVNGPTPGQTGIADIDCILGKWGDCNASGYKTRDVIVKKSGKGKACGPLSKRCGSIRSTKKTIDDSINSYPDLYNTRSIVNQLNFN